MTNQLAWQVCALSLLAPAVASAQAPRWQMQYFYDQAKSELVLQDIQTPSAQRGVAIGSIQESKGGRKPVAVVTIGRRRPLGRGETRREPGLAVLSE